MKTIDLDPGTINGLNLRRLIMFTTNNLDELIFGTQPHPEADTLTVISGYVGGNPVQRAALLSLKKVNIVVGMVNESGVMSADHDHFRRICRVYSSLDLRYSISQEIHSKIYLWSFKNQPLRALLGSANFTWAGLNSPGREFLSEAASSDLGDINSYCRQVVDSSVSCLDHRSDECVNADQTAQTGIPVEQGLRKLHQISLLDNTGEVPASSGLNWGLAAANVSPGDAYLPLRVTMIRSAPGLIPSKNQGKNTPVETIWDDGEVMVGYFEGSQPVDGITYPKQFASTPEKAILGRYIRGRLGVGLGHRITANDLRKYGRTSVGMSYMGPNRYFMHFGV